MPTTVTMKLTGLDSLIEVLRQLPPNVAGKLVKPAMVAAGNLLRETTRAFAFKQLLGAEARGYKRKEGVHLYETAAARAKTYRKGNTTFVAVGFDYKAGGFHAHLVEFGHQKVVGGSLRHGQQASITAAGHRLLTRMGLLKGDWQDGVILKGRRKGKPRIKRGSYRRAGSAEIIPILDTYAGRQVRGGGIVVGGKTRAYPILGPAFDVMRLPMLGVIERELRKIGPEAERLAKNVHKPVDHIIGGKLL